MNRFRAVESLVWRSASGRTASIYGALPWWTPAQKVAEGWHMVRVGFTVADDERGTVGYGQPPLATLAEAEALAAAWNAQHAARLAEANRRNAIASTAIGWAKHKGNDGVAVWHSGEGYSIRCASHGYVVVCPDGGQLFPMRSLAKAKAWCFDVIRRERLANVA